MNEEKCVCLQTQYQKGDRSARIATQKKPKIEKLKPCPFCGHTKPMLYDERKIGKGFEVTCRMCAAKVGGNKTEKEAIEAWNKRTETK